MNKQNAYKEANKMAILVLKEKLQESFLWTFCYEHGLDMCEIWNDDDTDIIGFAIGDYEYFYNGERG